MKTKVSDAMEAAVQRGDLEKDFASLSAGFRNEEGSEPGTLEVGDGIGLLSGYIEDRTYEDLAKWLEANTGKELVLMVNSSGGNAFAGIGAYNAMKRHGMVKVLVDGMAYSAASLIAIGGSPCNVGVGSTIGIHRASVLAYGNASTMDDASRVLRKVDSMILDIYADRAPAESMAEITELFNRDSFLSADDCVRLGLADGMEGDSETEGESEGGESLAENHKPSMPEALGRAPLPLIRG